jgi:hypothetical protein
MGWITITPRSEPMSTFASTICRRLARLAWAFLYLLASQPAHRYPWMARPGTAPGSDPSFGKLPKNGV